MKPIGLLLTLTLAASPAFSQTSPLFAPYESEKKEMAVAYVLTVLPGGGLYYAGDPAAGTAFLFAEGFIVTMGVESAHAEAGHINPEIMWGALLVVKALEYVLVTGTVNTYNENLRSRLQLTIDGAPRRGVTLTMQLHL